MHFNAETAFIRVYHPPCLPNDFELRHIKASSEELADHGIKAVEEIGDHYARKLDNLVCQKFDFQHENYQLFAD